MPESQTDLKNIDPGFIARLEGMGGTELVDKLLDIYFKRSIELIEAIQHGVRDSNLSMVENAAHSLISSAGNLGGTLTSRLSAQLERLAQQGDPAQVKEQADQVVEAEKDFKQFLKEYSSSK